MSAVVVAASGQCDRSGCVEGARATLSFDYGHRIAWLVDVGQPHPATYGLCQRHADGLRVPVGWTLRDQRRRPGARVVHAP